MYAKTLVASSEGTSRQMNLTPSQIETLRDGARALFFEHLVQEHGEVRTAAKRGEHGVGIPTRPPSSINAS